MIPKKLWICSSEHYTLKKGSMKTPTEYLGVQIKTGRIDIMVSIAMLSCFLANPREGHLNEAMHIFAYLKAYDHSSLVLTIKIYLLMKVFSIVAIGPNSIWMNRRQFC
jgi:hypothetical protein